MINNINESTIRDVIKRNLKSLYENGPTDEKNNGGVGIL